MSDAEMLGQAVPVISEQSFLSKAVDLGRTLMDGMHDLFDTTVDAASGTGAVVLSAGVAALGMGGAALVETAPASGASSAGASTGLTEAQCETEVLQRPAGLEGHYELSNPASDPNNHWYIETFSLPSVANCTDEGTRVTHSYQETNRGGGGWTFEDRTTDNGTVTTTVEPKINSNPIEVVKTNQAKKVRELYRAPNFCVDEGVGLHAIDAHGTKGRPVVQVTWIPRDGEAPVTKSFYGPASKLCK
jgi:hypothetical protein